MNYLYELKEILPPIEIIDNKVELDISGFSSYLIKKLQIDTIPEVSASFRHGWMHTIEYEYLEEITMGIKMLRYLVPTQKEVDFFYKNEIYNVYPVGVPYIYIDKEEYKHIKRIKNSLLVMPPHSLPGTNPNFFEEIYLDEIKRISTDFRHIVFCIHQSCIKKNLWIKNIEKYGFLWIEGANSNDKNSLIRMHRLFSSFEFMTTNSFGSHIAYASYSGCKVSLYGTYQGVKKEDIKDYELFQRIPKLIDRIEKIFSYEYIKKYYHFFIVDNPKNAKFNVKWANDELGVKYKKSYIELAELLGWYKNGKLNVFPQFDLLDFSSNLSKLYNFIKELKKDKKYVVYGNGSCGNIIKQILGESCLIIVDKISTNLISDMIDSDTVYSIENINNIDFDFLIISVLGREETIANYLVNVLQIQNQKIIKINLE